MSFRHAYLLVSLPLALACDPAPTSDAGRTDAAQPTRDGGTDGGEMDATVDDAGASDAGAAIDAALPDAGPALRLDDVVAELSDGTASAADLDALIERVSLEARWPLRDGTRWLFATRWDGAGASVSLVSDVNGWDSARAPANRAASGVHYFVVIDESTFDVAPAGAGVKWFAAPSTYRAGPEITAYGYDTFGELGYVAPPIDAAYRERFGPLRSAFLDEPRRIRAYLPAGFTPHGVAAASARVLLLHDGQNVFHPDAPFGGWQADAAVSRAGFEDVVILAIDNAPDRFDAYTHVPDDPGLGGGPIGGRADDYAQLVFEEALPFFRARYGLSGDAAKLAIGGSSLGGLVTLYLAEAHDGDFACAIAMSSTLGWGAFAGSSTDALVQRWSTHGSVSIYLDSGGGGTCADADGDGVMEDSSDSDNFCTTNQMRDHLASLGYEFGVDLSHWHEPGAQHNEAAWAARLPRALDACAAMGW
ncbi:MAG: alpha/beta hydrolase [Sandaracinaceae bacterium]